MAKKSLLSSNNAKKKNSKSKTEPVAVAMKSKAPKPNPFESIWSRRKFDVLGKKRKGEERRIGLARSRAIDKRKRTLLKEYEQSGKASVFLDKRIGENNEGMEEFEKAILRSQREYKLKQSKKSKYNLSDGEEEDFELGEGLFGEKDDFEDEVMPDDDDANADEVHKSQSKSAILKQLDGDDTQNSVETDAMEGEENKHKTKKEVMEEIIFKSKLFKAQKAKDKEENVQLMEELDKNFTSLVQSEALRSLTEPGKMNALRALVHKSIPNDPNNIELSALQKGETFSQDKPDTYDKLVKEMSLDMRARPSDRLKTPEEIAQEEREHLERLEEERQKRMQARDDQSDDDNGDEDEKPPLQQYRSISGDDLGDSFSVEEMQTKRGWVDDILERRDADSSEDGEGDSSEELGSAEEDGDEDGLEEEADENEKIDFLKDWEQSDDDKLDTDLESEEEEEDADNEEEEEEEEVQEEQNGDYDVTGDEQEMPLVERKKVKERSRDANENKKKPANLSEETVSNSGVALGKAQAKSLPCLIDAPKTLEELNSLLEDHSNNDILILITRIRASNAIALAAENRKKMQVFYGVLLQYFAVLANQKLLNYELLNMLVKPLIEMSSEIPYFAAICARQRILRIRSLFCEAIRNTDSSSWPSLKTLFLLRLWSLIFPCSDFRHVVMTPAILLMCEYLMRCPVSSGQDIAIGSFLCSIILSVTRHSRKYCPEAIMFLQTVLLAALDKKKMSSHSTKMFHLMELRLPNPILCLQDKANEIDPLNFLEIVDMPDNPTFFSSDNFRVAVLMTAVETLKGFVDIYTGLSSFPEIFQPIALLLLEVAIQENMPDELQSKLKEVAHQIKTKSDGHIQRPLQMRKQKPMPIKLLNPKFEENFVKGRDYDPDRERAERRKLKKLLKREAKGAVRELRKDNYFLLEQKEKDKARLEEERTEKYGKARAFLQEQEHAFKSGQLGKGRKRRR